ncbi:hypothetical protein AK812_SmicGene47611, partial [Symbiodinium microadriaticum]
YYDVFRPRTPSWRRRKRPKWTQNSRPARPGGR